MSQNQVGKNMKIVGSTSTDPIADMLSRIRNAILVRKAEIMVPQSKLKKAILQVLVDNNFIVKSEEISLGVGKVLKVTLNNPNENARITHISRISKPGRRMYVKSKDIPKVKHGRGIVIVSTSKGLVTDKQARQQALGGELICKVY